MVRETKQRHAIRQALAAAGRPLLPHELLTLAQEQVPRLGIATVYRNLQAMLDAGEIVQVRLPGESARFEPAGTEHHHYFKCHGCGTVATLPTCPGNLADMVPPGFSVSGHELTLYGFCSFCAGAGKPASGAGLVG